MCGGVECKDGDRILRVYFFPSLSRSLAAAGDKTGRRFLKIQSPRRAGAAGFLIGGR
jgi:hypothetical protein